MRRRQANSVMTEGAKVRLRRSIERAEDLLIPAGETGTVVEVGPSMVSVRLDKHFPELDEWDNELQWTYDDYNSYPEEVELVREAKVGSPRRSVRRRVADQFSSLVEQYNRLVDQGTKPAAKLETLLDRVFDSVRDAVEREEEIGDGIQLWLGRQDMYPPSRLVRELEQALVLLKELASLEEQMAALEEQATILEGRGMGTEG